MVTSEAIGRFLEGGTKDEVHGSADQLLRLTRHFEQSGGGDRHGLVQCHQEVDITVRADLAARRRAKHLQPTDAVFLAKRAQPPPQLISELRPRRSRHIGRIARPRPYFKADLLLPPAAQGAINLHQGEHLI